MILVADTLVLRDESQVAFTSGWLFFKTTAFLEGLASLINANTSSLSKFELEIANSINSFTSSLSVIFDSIKSD